MSEPNEEEIVYRFPYGRAAVEIVPDIADTFCLRLFWHKGKTVLPLFESTPLRPLAQATVAGQTFPLFLSRHARKKRERIQLEGRRKVARSQRAVLRFGVSVEGREDQITWRWKVSATAAAAAAAAAGSETAPSGEDAVILSLPFAPGRADIVTLPGAGDGLAIWMKDIAVSVVIGPVKTSTPTAASDTVRASAPEMTADSRGVHLTLRGLSLSGGGAEIHWETWFCPARSEEEARDALLRHLADAADRKQKRASEIRAEMAAADGEGGTSDSDSRLLTRLVDEAQAVLTDERALDKYMADRLIYRDLDNEGSLRRLNGEGTDAALAAHAILGRYFLTGDDALRRHARLMGHAICDFHVNTEEAPNWGALWDTWTEKKRFAGANGEKTVSVSTVARASRGLHLLHDHFETDLFTRTARTAAQWLLLKIDSEGFMAGERYSDEGRPLPGGSPWVMAEALLPFVATFRRTRNETFFRAALRIVGTIRRELSSGSRLRFDNASAEHLAAAVEGILAVSREYENPEMITLARQIAAALRARRAPDGTMTEPPGVAAESRLSPTLAGARAALALTRVDTDPLWPVFALRALRAADAMAREDPASVTLADRAALCTLPTGLLVALAARAAGGNADRDTYSVTRGWQTFAPEPTTREFVRVERSDGSGRPIDHLALVCPATLHTLIAVLAPADVSEATIIKSGRHPMVRNLITGDLDPTARLSPLDPDAPEANIGVYIVDT